jgi:hypothetical protein
VNRRAELAKPESEFWDSLVITAADEFGPVKPRAKSCEETKMS